MTRPGHWRGERRTQLWHGLPGSDDRVRHGESQFFLFSCMALSCEFRTTAALSVPHAPPRVPKGERLGRGGWTGHGAGDGDRWAARRRARPRPRRCDPTAEARGGGLERVGRTSASLEDSSQLHCPKSPTVSNRSVQPMQVPSLPAHSLACAPCSCAKRPASRAGARIVGQCTCWAGSTTSFPRAFAGVVCSILPVSDPPPPSPCPAQRLPPTAPRSWRLRRPPRYCRPAGPPARPGGHCGCAGMARRRRPTGGCGG